MCDVLTKTPDTDLCALARLPLTVIDESGSWLGGWSTRMKRLGASYVRYPALQVCTLQPDPAMITTVLTGSLGCRSCPYVKSRFRRALHESLRLHARALNAFTARPAASLAWRPEASRLCRAREERGAEAARRERSSLCSGAVSQGFLCLLRGRGCDILRERAVAAASGGKHPVGEGKSGWPGTRACLCRTAFATPSATRHHHLPVCAQGQPESERL